MALTFGKINMSNWKKFGSMKRTNPTLFLAPNKGLNQHLILFVLNPQIGKVDSLLEKHFDLMPLVQLVTLDLRKITLLALRSV